MNKTNIFSQEFKGKFRAFLTGHFFHLPDPTGSLKVYKFGGLFASTFCGDSISVLGLPLSQHRQT